MLDQQNSLLAARAVPEGGVLVVLCIIMSLVAGLAFAGMVAAARKARLATLASRERGRSFRRFKRTVRTVERLAGLGVWEFLPDTGEQIWSHGMRAIFGIDHDDPLVAGNAENVLFANDIDLVANVMLHQDETESYKLRFDAVDQFDLPLSLSIEACNHRGDDGAVERVIAVVRNITEQVARERELENSRAMAECEADRARELASTDPLTGLANRRKVMAELDRLSLRARATHQDLSLIIFDIDHFKSVNDTFGHALGDEVLKRVAEIAMAQARESDVIGRIGGEEFVWIVPGASEDMARQLAERLREAIASYRAPNDALPIITTSVGCAEMLPGDSTLTLFARADGALYDAKHAGRNRVRMAA